MGTDGSESVVSPIYSTGLTSERRSLMQKVSIRLGFLFAVVFVCLAPTQTTIIHAGLLLDGKGGVARDRLITVSGGRIQSVAKGVGPADIDLGKLTMMPGWIDTHVHLDWHFDADGKLAKPNTGSPEELVLFDSTRIWSVWKAIRSKTSPWFAIWRL
jgi:hypothetical protein